MPSDERTSVFDKAALDICSPTCLGGTELEISIEDRWMRAGATTTFNAKTGNSYLPVNLYEKKKENAHTRTEHTCRGPKKYFKLWEAVGEAWKGSKVYN